MKYIINSCPAFIDFDEQSLLESLCSKYGGACEKHKNCLLKRIVERCNLYEFNYPVNQAIIMLTQNIKDMLEIEEVE